MPIELSDNEYLNRQIIVNLSKGKTVVWLEDEKIKKIIKPPKTGNKKDIIYVKGNN